MKIISGICLFLFFISFVGAVPFVPGAGGKPSKADRRNYSERSENYDGKFFHNISDVKLSIGKDDNDPLRVSKNDVRPDFELEEKNPSLIENPELNDFSVTWFGHSTLLVQIHGFNILVDPVFSERISPVSWAGPKKFAVKDFDVSSLPQIDYMILSHDHYDHLDYGFIKKFDSKINHYIVPLGVEAHLKKWKVKADKISNMAWWEELNLDGLTVTAVPAEHFSGRWITGRNQTLWNGYVLKDEFHTIFLSGDSGYGEHFKTIGEKFGGFDLAVLECGQYNTRWPEIHSFPEETALEAVELKARLAMPVHWGAIVLSTNGWDDSVERFVKKAGEYGVDYITPYLCQTVDISAPENYREQWWK